VLNFLKMYVDALSSQFSANTSTKSTISTE
jgi:hypothetical protein